MGERERLTVLALLAAFALHTMSNSLQGQSGDGTYGGLFFTPNLQGDTEVIAGEMPPPPELPTRQSSPPNDRYFRRASGEATNSPSGDLEPPGNGQRATEGLADDRLSCGTACCSGSAAARGAATKWPWLGFGSTVGASCRVSSGGCVTAVATPAAPATGRGPRRCCIRGPVDQQG